mmetsp:Transcript_7635/g.13367  ORF Transcript_7635/g.13367 Transcript_7635/m.13367 type:complete len:920 (+) Transcript_7635:63-2822(+)
MAAVWALAVVLAGAVDGAAGQLPSTLRYFMTVRDFLPSHCLSESDYKAVWDTANGFNYAGLTDEEYAQGVDLSQQTLADRGFNNNAYPNIDGVDMKDIVTMDKYCPYFDFMRSGEVSGHPDFETDRATLKGGPTDCYFGGERTDSCGTTFSSLVSPSQIKLSNGLFKVQYCPDGSEDQRDGKCGFAGSGFVATTKEFFDLWYNDNSKYNKRVGIPLDLKLINVDTRLYQFNSVDENDLKPFFRPLKELRFPEEKYPNPFEAPVWPSSFVQLEKGFDFEELQLDFSSKYWYTVEIHTFFQYRGDEVFTFEGDDDVFVFVNNKLIIDLGGTHSPVEKTIALSDFEDTLGLTVNQTYNFDLYQAERHFSGSNFRLATTLSAPCNIIDSGTPAFLLAQAQESDIALGGGGATFNSADNSVTLTSFTSTPQRSTYMFPVQRINVGTGFEMSFDFKASQDGVHNGFAVVLYGNDDLVDFPSSTGFGLGFQFLRNAVAIAFDLCEDRSTPDTECASQSVTMYYPDDPSTPIQSVSGNKRVFDNILRSLKLDGETHSVRVVFFQDPDWLEVYVDDSLYLREEGFDVTKAVNGRDAFVGITTATSSTPGELVISDLNINAVSLKASRSTQINPNEVQVFQTDGIDSALLSVQTRDACGNLLGAGGAANLMKGVFVEKLQFNSSTYFNGSLSPNVEEAVIVDNNDGTFSAKLSTLTPGDYVGYACFGECELAVDTVVGEGNLEQVIVRDVDIGGSSDYIFFSEADTIQGVPLTGFPTSAPIALGEQSGLDPDIVAYLAVGGGIAFLFLTSMGFVAYRRRRAWRNARGFIEDGRIVNISKTLDYGPKADEYDAAGRRLQATRLQVIKERAQTSRVNRGDEVSALERQNQELKDQVRYAKQSHMQAREPPSRRPAPNRFQRREFQPSAEDL